MGLAGLVAVVRRCGDRTRARATGLPMYAAKVGDPSAEPLSWERIEGVSRSLPNSDLLALTSSHMFLSVMN